MSFEIEIAMAGPEDAHALGTVMVRAMEPHMIDKFLVPDMDFRSAYDAKLNWFLSSYAVNLADPMRRIFKASIKSTGEIVGLGGIQYHDGNFSSAPKVKGHSKSEGSTGTTTDSEPAAAAILKQKMPPGFAQYYFGELGQIHQKHMHGVKHVVWTTLHVAPEFQGKGVGGALLRWGFKEYDLDNEQVWLGTQMRGRNIYRRFGFEDVDHFDVDLSEWGGKLRGFGIHRSPLMLRQPGEFKKLEGFIDE